MNDVALTVRRCPICSEPADAAFRPFCSKRCADIDLHRWFSGHYSVPAVEADDDEEPDVPGRRPAQGDEEP